MVPSRSQLNGAGTAKSWPTAVDLFCGSGAVTESLKRRHFHVIAAVDQDAVACKTYRLNHPSVSLYETDIRTFDPAKIKRDLLGERTLDLLVVCAPCQPFSSQNRRKENDSRMRLILEAARFARVLRPSVIFFENVPGLAAPGNAKLLRQLKHRLPAGYSLSVPLRIDAADYGVPQRRVRCIMFASRKCKSLPVVPSPTSPQESRVTVRDAIYHLSRIKSGESSPNDELHFARSHKPIALKRLSAIPKDGGSRLSLPKRLQLACHETHTGHPDVYGRMRWNDVAPTLTTGCTDITKGRYAHPEDDRAITLREAAMLQTFPLSYKFAGKAGDIATQIGNAVPVKLMDRLIPSIRAVLKAPAR